MNPPSKDRLIFFGTDAFSLPSLVKLIAEKWHIVAVVTKPDSRMGRGRELSAPAVKKLAVSANIQVLQPARLSEIEGELRSLRPDAGIVVAYGKIIRPAILDLFPKGLVNVHASLLPKYRGASPIEAAIKNGDEVTGVTLMKLDHGMDTGPTYAADKLQLAGTETRPDLYAKLAEMGAKLLSGKLPAILSGNIVSIPQDSAQASHVGLIKKADGRVDWTKPADAIEREIRAYLGWPGSYTKINGTPVTITASHISPKDGEPGTAYISPSSELAVYANMSSLIIDRLTPAGKREMTGIEFLAGHNV
ncbi:MAG TPA: methionyl-tRNA formyltransferase [Candidatus Saccharimonadia bacterium]|nr:methionyl-tRNA formyltransferase [Candidatus Saccharimonadia bacterium]